ncbi:MAG: (Fe-S)-binding protein [Candidatus Eisenbacteria bacterium]|nr:(Fe-S)-binding protein [Candidatus Eisenbacteria bacterium]
MVLEPRLVYRKPLTDKYPQIAHAAEEIARCTKCGLCRAVCPTLIETVSESQGARGRVSLVEAVLDGRLALSDVFADRLSTCINCKACIEACPSGVRVDDVVLAARAELVSRGKFPVLKRLILRSLLKRGRLLPPVGKTASLLQRALLKLSPKGSALRLLLPLVRIDKERSLPVFASRSFREQVPGRLTPEMPRGSTPVPSSLETLVPKPREGKENRLKVAYFVGCASNLIYTNVAFSVVDVLTKLGVEVVIPPLQGCCGTPIFNAGDLVTAREMARKNIHALAASDVDAIVVSCASCGLALKREYSKILGLETSGLSEKVMDVSEFIVKKVGLDALRAVLSARSPASRVPTGDGALHRELTVTYHDPCHLKRGQGVRDEPREIIRSIPGVKFVEMQESDRCCGGGGLYSFTHYEMSRAVVARKVKAIEESGAEIVLTSCPSCMLQLTDALTQAGLPVRVMHVMEFLAQNAC